MGIWEWRRANQGIFSPQEKCLPLLWFTKKKRSKLKRYWRRDDEKMGGGDFIFLLVPWTGIYLAFFFSFAFIRPCRKGPAEPTAARARVCVCVVCSVRGGRGWIERALFLFLRAQGGELNSRRLVF